MNIVNCLFRNYEVQRTAIVSGERTISYNKLCNNVIGFGEHINGSRDVVTIYMENSIEFVIGYFAALLAGKKVLLINPMYPDSEVKKYMELVNSDLLITNSESSLLRDNFTIMVPAVSEGKDYGNPVIGDRDDEGAVIIPTSGTTGEAKLIMLTHKNICTNVLDIIDAYEELRIEDIEMIILPMTSIFSHTAQMLVPLYIGMIIDIWTGGFNIPGIINEIKDRKVSYCQMVPAILKMFVHFYTKMDIKLDDFRRTTIGGEPISVDELERLSKAIAPIKILQGYGMTETSPVISSQKYLNEVFFGSVGQKMKSINVRIEPIEDGKKEGLIFVKGPSVCQKTYDGKNVTDDNGWLNTGDIGYFDNDNELHICGRKKNLIVVGGMNVYPEEVEAIIKGVEGVVDALVYGEKNDIKGEIVKAKITVLNKVDVFEVKKYCSKHLPIYKVPEIIEIVDEIEKTYSSKIKRF